MWARVSTYDGSPGNLDEGETYARNKILPQVRELAGFRGIYALADRETGRTLSITLWESEQDMRASEAEADRLREDGAQHAAGTVTKVERYEVSFHELA